MNNNFKNSLLIGMIPVIILMTSCRKEAIRQSFSANNTESAMTGSDSVLKALKIKDIIGEYSTRGSQTVYNGQANEQGDNIKLTLDFFLTKYIYPSADKKHLSCPYGYGKYTSRGWKYIIGYDYKNKKIILEPNDIMASQIVPGSFKTLYADYDAAFNSFTFQTRFTAIEDNGNESEMVEPLNKN